MGSAGEGEESKGMTHLRTAVIPTFPPPGDPLFYLTVIIPPFPKGMGGSELGGREMGEVNFGEGMEFEPIPSMEGPMTRWCPLSFVTRIQYPSSPRCSKNAIPDIPAS